MECLVGSTQKNIQRTYRYLFEDDIEQVDTKDEICKEYFIGKFAPLKNSLKPKRRRYG